MKITIEFNLPEEREEYEHHYHSLKVRRMVESLFDTLKLAVDSKEYPARQKLSNLDSTKFMTLTEEQYDMLVDTLILEMQDHDIPLDHIHFDRL